MLPNRHTAESIKDSTTTTLGKRDRWVPARPFPLYGSWLSNLRQRLSLAWGVFKGRYDALDWEDYHD